jgi:hypothetical protein
LEGGVSGLKVGVSGKKVEASASEVERWELKSDRSAPEVHQSTFYRERLGCSGEV